MTWTAVMHRRCAVMRGIGLTGVEIHGLCPREPATGTESHVRVDAQCPLILTRGGV
jgi:hypothetical protein